ncbi:MAG: chemotaxis protein CheA [Candidatus Hydrogenedentota bacterium]
MTDTELSHESALSLCDEAAVKIINLQEGDLSELFLVRKAVQDLLALDIAQESVREHGERMLDLLDRTIFEGDLTVEEARPQLMAGLEELRAPLLADSLMSESGSQEELPEIEPELLKEGITESLENLEAGEAALLVLDQDPSNREEIDRLFRAFHSVKGFAGFAGMKTISRVAHTAENLLDRVRKSELVLTTDSSALLYRSLDVLRRILHSESVDGIDELCRNLDRVSSGEEVVRVAAVPAKAVPASKPRGEEKPARDSAESGTLRVSTLRMDKLIDLIGEMVIAQAILADQEEVARAPSSPLAQSVLRSSKILREIQDLAVAFRTVPLKTTFQRMARLARDLSASSGKAIAFRTEGEETEIDRTLVEKLVDPLTHMIRNSCDHGIESESERAAAGKPREGTILLSARHEAGQVVIQIHDDGRGLDPARLKAKAEAAGLLSPDSAARNQDLYQVIFLPGFSTAEKITDVSGRGVGMDVVKRNVEELRGRIEVASETGKGTTFTIRFPLTLAIIDGMLVAAAGRRSIIPFLSIREIISPDAAEIRTVMGEGELIVLRGKTIPVFSLRRVLGDDCPAGHARTGKLFVIVEDGGELCALSADDVLGHQQYVLKSLDRNLGRIPGIAGSAILGDGTVSLILDIPVLVARARERNLHKHSNERSTAS